MVEQPKIREYDKVKYSDKDMWWARNKLNRAFPYIK